MKEAIERGFNGLIQFVFGTGQKGLQSGDPGTSDSSCNGRNWS